MGSAQDLVSTPALDQSGDAPASRSSGGQAARERLLAEAVRLFAEQGFAQTSTRAIAQAAGANISAISYYFGDKEGLYRTAYHEPFAEHDAHAVIAAFTDPRLSLQEALQAFFGRLLEPLMQGAQMQQCMRLHMREMLEPTGLWQEEVAQRIVPLHEALQALVARHLGLAQPDEGIQRLVLSLVSMPWHLMIGHDVVLSVCPPILQQTHAVQLAVDALVRYALALVQSEADGRGLRLDLAQQMK